jgi:hypothetical protein
MSYNRMFGFLKTKTFDVIFSFILGLGCMALLKPVCKGDACEIHRAPPYEEVKTSTYQMGEKCYQFKANPVECPTTGVIEPFQRFVR